MIFGFHQWIKFITSLLPISGALLISSNNFDLIVWGLRLRVLDTGICLRSVIQMSWIILCLLSVLTIWYYDSISRWDSRSSFLYEGSGGTILYKSKLRVPILSERWAETYFISIRQSDHCSVLQAQSFGIADCSVEHVHPNCGHRDTPW